MDITLNDLVGILTDGRKIKGDKSYYGVVDSVITKDDKVVGYNVIVGDSTIEARKMAGANVGDTVLCTTLSNGQVVITGALDGDKDALIAREVADDTATDLATNYPTRDDMDEAIDEAIGGIEVASEYKMIQYNYNDTGTTPSQSDSKWSFNFPEVGNWNYIYTREVTIKDGEIIAYGTASRTNAMYGVTSFINSVKSTATTIDGDAIYGGTITLGGSNNVNGQLTVNNSYGSTTAQLNNNGIYAIAGTIGGLNLTNSSMYSDSGGHGVSISTTKISNYGTVSGTTRQTTLEEGRVITTMNNAKSILDYDELILMNTTTGNIYSYYGSDCFVDYDLCAYGAYDRTTTSTANGRIATSASTGLGQGTILRYSSSSQRWKHDIEELSDDDLKAENLYDLPVKQFKYNEGYLIDNDDRIDKNIPGFIAEDVNEYYPIACDYDDDHLPEDWNVKMLVPGMLKLIQDQKKEIDELKARVERLESNSVNGMD